MTLRSFLVVILLVGVITILLFYFNPSTKPIRKEPVIVEDEGIKLGFHEIIGSLTYDNYTRYDIDYWYPEGVTLIELGDTSYTDGALRGYGEPNVLSGEFYLVWKPSGYFDDWSEALDYVIRLTGEGISYDESQVLKTGHWLSWQGHYNAVCMVNGTGPYADRWVGRFIAQKCTETERAFLYLYVNFDEFDPYDYIKNGSVYFATYSCHPIEGTPIERISGVQ